MEIEFALQIKCDQSLIAQLELITLVVFVCRQTMASDLQNVTHIRFHNKLRPNREAQPVILNQLFGLQAKI